MPTLNMPGKSGTTSSTNSADDIEVHGQTKPVQHRFRLQVDRQTKATFKERATAEKRGTDIKNQFPKVQVIIYDADAEERLVITG